MESPERRDDGLNDFMQESDYISTERNTIAADSASSTATIGPRNGPEGASSHPARKHKGGRKLIYATVEARKQRNRQAQATFRERRTEYIAQLEKTIEEQKIELDRLKTACSSATDERLNLKYKNSLLERIMLERGVDVQTELNLTIAPLQTASDSEQVASLPSVRRISGDGMKYRNGRSESPSLQRFCGYGEPSSYDEFSSPSQSNPVASRLAHTAQPTMLPPSRKVPFRDDCRPRETNKRQPYATTITTGFHQRQGPINTRETLTNKGYPALGSKNLRLVPDMRLSHGGRRFSLASNDHFSYDARVHASLANAQKRLTNHLDQEWEMRLDDIADGPEDPPENVASMSSSTSAGTQSPPEYSAIDIPQQNYAADMDRKERACVYPVVARPYTPYGLDFDIGQGHDPFGLDASLFSI